MTRRAAFTQADVTRAVKAAVAGGIAVGTVRISPDGVIEVYSRGEESAPRLNPLDKHFGMD